MSDLPPVPDPHFGSDEDMLEWCKTEGLIPRKDSHGNWDWMTVWQEYTARFEEDGKFPAPPGQL